MSYEVCVLNCSCSTLVTASFESLRPNRLFGGSPAGELLAAAFFAEAEPLAFHLCRPSEGLQRLPLATADKATGLNCSGWNGGVGGRDEKHGWDAHDNA
eukprot:11455655-Alexandrium_andersonii.AAC.1